MAIILHIDTAVETASICLTDSGNILGYKANTLPKEHSSWLHSAIKTIYDESERSLGDTQAIAVTVGPGSYTGLRVGLSAAKGLCFSLGIPLISIGTLELIACSANNLDVDFIVPVIDARRMEIFTALYSSAMSEIEKPHALIVDENSFSGLASQGSILITGNAVTKMKGVLGNEGIVYVEQMPDARSMITLAEERFKARQFSDMAYIEPMYVKEFYQSNH